MGVLRFPGPRESLQEVQDLLGLAFLQDGHAGAEADEDVVTEAGFGDQGEADVLDHVADPAVILEKWRLVSRLLG